MKHLAIAATALLAWSAAAQDPEPRPVAAAENRSRELSKAQNRIDRIRPDAPELAPTASTRSGFRTLTFTDEGRIDVVNTTEEGEPPTYDREITVEVWYPAAEGTEPGGAYQALLATGRPR
jgi:hypothetical protein